MYYQYEIESLRVGHSVENKHCLDGEMPRPCTVGSRHNHRNAAHDKRHQSAGQAQAGCEIEAEEREIIMKKVACPNGNGVENELRHVANFAQRHHTLPYPGERFLNLIIYRQLAQYDVDSHAGCDATYDSHYPTRRRELHEEVVEARSGL